MPAELLALLTPMTIVTSMLLVSFLASTLFFFLRAQRLTLDTVRLRAECEALERQQAQQLERVAQLQEDRERLEDEGRNAERSWMNTRNQLERELALARSTLDSERRQMAEKISLLENSEQRLNSQFENLANRIFEQKQQAFSKTSQESLNHLMQPMREQLKDFRQRVEQVYEKDTDDRRELRLQLASLRQLNEEMNQEARALTNALKGEKKLQGNWGEMLLERILEESGLRKGHEYDTQLSFTGKDGSRQQPDAVIHLPDQKDVIVDAKVSLVSFERYCNTEDDERALHLKGHLKAVRNQMENLTAKNYEDIAELKTLDFVLMFVPIEAAFLLAMENDPQLFRDAFDRNIILVSPSTLLAVLKTIHNIWRNEQQNRNAQTIAEEAGKLYDHFVRFTESLQDVQKHLRKTQESMDQSMNRLSSGRGNLVGRVENLRKLGARNKKQLALADESPDGLPLEEDSE
ncbi:DNA recombination protein RmuC [Salinispirillum marinum]|uniref:DNA recombination protein RmuC n=2 Tax=Saccharospirillaceae TaxID=255527 RepID=A0ABV8BFN4_9GAMM